MGSRVFDRHDSSEPRSFCSDWCRSQRTLHVAYGCLGGCASCRAYHPRKADTFEASPVYGGCLGDGRRRVVWRQDENSTGSDRGARLDRACHECRNSGCSARSQRTRIPGRRRRCGDCRTARLHDAGWAQAGDATDWPDPERLDRGRNCRLWRFGDRLGSIAQTIAAVELGSGPGNSAPTDCSSGSGKTRIFSASELRWISVRSATPGPSKPTYPF